MPIVPLRTCPSGCFCANGRLVGKTGTLSLLSEGKHAVLAKNSHASAEPTVLSIKKTSTYLSKLFNTLAQFFILVNYEMLETVGITVQIFSQI